MKKYVKILILVVVLLLVSACGKVSNQEFVKKCKLTTNDASNGYKLESEYKIYGKGDVVEKVETIETITSTNEEILEYFEEYLEETYEEYDKIYGGYTNEVENENGKVVSKTIIDYNIMDVEQYVEDNSGMKNYVNSNNKLLLKGIINIYESLGAVCE